MVKLTPEGKDLLLMKRLFIFTVLFDKVLLAVIVAAAIYIATRPSPPTIDPAVVSCKVVK